MLFDLNKDNGVTLLNTYLTERSYIEGYVPSQADVAVFNALKGKCPLGSSYPHAERWFNHIKSYDTESRKQFPKSQKPVEHFIDHSWSNDQEDGFPGSVITLGSDDEEETSAAANNDLRHSYQ